MQRTKRGWAAAGAIAAAVGMAQSLAAGSPAQATGSTGSITDADGVDYDPTCVVEVPTTGRVANSVASPGGTGCSGTTFYDGSVEAADIRSASLESTSSGWLKGSITVDGALPAPGSTNATAIDGPVPPLERGSTSFAHYVLLFQNKDKQHGADNTGSGCHSSAGARRADRHGHWADGYHYFLQYSVEYDTGRWVHRLSVGEFTTDNPPLFEFSTVARNAGGGWVTAEPAMAGRYAASLTGSGPTTIDMEVTGRVHVADANCATPSGYAVFDMASTTPGPFSGPGYTGDTIANVKAATIIDMKVRPVPVTVILNEQEEFISWNGYADTTAGASTAGALSTNIPGIALTTGTAAISTENFANGPFCRPGVLGIRVQNPLATLNPNQPCQVDDDPVARGSVHMEWWETPYGFTF